MCFISVAVTAYLVVPILYTRVSSINEKRQQKFTADMEQILARKEAQKKVKFLILAPVVFGGVCLLLFPDELKLAGALMGLVIGFVFPRRA